MAEKPAWNVEDAHAIIAAHARGEGALLVVLEALNNHFGYVHKDAVPQVARALNLSRAEVHGVASFYHDFRGAPPGRHVLRLCAAEACQSMGAEKLAADIAQSLGIAFGETTADNRVTLERVYCLGLCACAPAALLDEEPIGRLDSRRAADLLAEIGG